VVGDSVVLVDHVVSRLFGQVLLGGWLVVGSLGKIWGSQWWCFLIKVVLAGESRYSIKREPHLVDIGVESFLGVAQIGDDVAIRVGVSWSSATGWLAGCWVSGEDLGQSVVVLVDQSGSGWG
jgi:hypothetical protein